MVGVVISITGIFGNILTSRAGGEFAVFKREFPVALYGCRGRGAARCSSIEASPLFDRGATYNRNVILMKLLRCHCLYVAWINVSSIQRSLCAFR